MRFNVIKYILALIVCSNIIFAQTADVTKGCGTLLVNFSGTNQGTHYWDFKDGTISTIQFPAHLFTKPGIYEVEYKRNRTGNVIRKITITVYEYIKLMSSVDDDTVCANIPVQFTGQVMKDPGINILAYQWVFGDGDVSALQNPTHSYTNASINIVSFGVKTDVKGCDIVDSSNLKVVVGGVPASFEVDTPKRCQVPATFEFINTSDFVPGAEYTWNFKNGTSSTDYNPRDVQYRNRGAYDVNLMIVDKLGEEKCTTNVTKQILVGPPYFKLTIPDTVCINSLVLVNNGTAGDAFRWTFDPSASVVSAEKTAILLYRSSGLKTINVVALNPDPRCQVDTTFQIYVEDPSAAFTFTPTIDCLDPTKVNITFNDKSHRVYRLNDSIDIKADYVLEYKPVKRDTFYTNRFDTFYLNMAVTTHAGCVDTAQRYFLHQRPDAHFLADKTSGCVPLEVTFSDTSTSHNAIIKRTWIFGDGSTMVQNNDQDLKHTYTQPGEYYVKMIVENQSGCIDTSYGVWIRVGDKIQPTYTIDKKGICLGDSITVNFTNSDPRIDGYHFESDNGRFDHCFLDKNATHGFITEPGVFDAYVTIEYNGCFTEIEEKGLITVKGANADIAYMLTCEKPFDLMVNSEGLNANKWTWNFGDQSSSNEDSTVHTYAKTGSYWLTLTVEDSQSGCPAQVDSFQIFIKNVKADFTVNDFFCDNQEYTLNSSISLDADIDCHSGYLWYLPNSRPRETNVDSIKHQFVDSGLQEIRLIVEDINGCRDTMTKYRRNFRIDIKYTDDKDEMCLPMDVQFKDISKSDTTIFSRIWSFGGSQINEKHRFNVAVDDYIVTTLTLTDVMGCEDEYSDSIRIYKPEGIISYDKGLGLCPGDSVRFNAFEDGNKYPMSYEWEFGSIGKRMGDAHTIGFPIPGKYNVVLNYKEDSSGCSGSVSTLFTVIKHPEALIAPSTVEECAPKIINLFDGSIVESEYNVRWIVNGSLTNQTDKTYGIEIKPGVNTFQIIAISEYGCADTSDVRFITGKPFPTGRIVLTNDSLCSGNSIQISLVDTSRIKTLEWIVQNGVKIVDQNPITTVYTNDSAQLTSVKTVQVKLTSPDINACDTTLSIPLTVIKVHADFDTLFVSDTAWCTGLITLKNKSINADKYEWDFGGGFGEDTSTNPVVILPTSGPYKVQLRAINSSLKCQDEFDKIIDAPEAPGYYTVPNVFSPNGDMVNDNFTIAIKEGFEKYIEVRDLKVFNRWGEMLYNNENPSTGWNGVYKSEQAPLEVYAYFIKILIRDKDKNLECKEDQKKGNVTIIR